MVRKLVVALFVFFAAPLFAQQQIQIIGTPTGSPGQIGGPTGVLTDQGPSRAICGGANQPRCGGKGATFQSYGLTECPAGTFFDLLRWSCWTCPAGMNRSADAVDTAFACEVKDAGVRGEFQPARRGGGQCPPGSFFDSIRGGECWACPGGYQRTAAHVEWPDACIAPQEFRGAQRFNRGRSRAAIRRTATSSTSTTAAAAGAARRGSRAPSTTSPAARPASGRARPRRPGWCRRPAAGRASSSTSSRAARAGAARRSSAAPYSR
jgi:hypothetical protein